MRILFIGDVVGKPGRLAVRHLLPELRSRRKVDVVIANGENAAGGMGITPAVAEELFSYGIDLLTMGNHIWDKKEGVRLAAEEVRLLRPLNYPAGVPGQGSAFIVGRNKVRMAVINVQGRVFFPAHLDCPFRSVGREVERLRDMTPLIVVDFHAEATSEKMAMGWHLDGKVTAVIGTHTHVQTADARVLPGGTAYVTDVGMTGPVDTVIGIKKELALQKFLTQMPVPFEVGRGERQLAAAFIEADPETGRAVAIETATFRDGTGKPEGARGEDHA